VSPFKKTPFRSSGG